MKTLVLVLSVAVVALSITSVRLYRQLDAERSARAALAPVATALAEPGTLEQSSAAPPEFSPPEPLPPATPAARPLSVSVKLPVVEASRKSAGMNEQELWQETQRQMLRDPASRRLLRAEYDAEVRARHPDLQRELGLADAEYEKLIGVLTEHRLRMADSIANQRALENGEPRRREIQELLGKEKAAAFERYEDSVPVREQVRRFRSQLTESLALTDDQSTRLVAALAETRQTYREEQRAARGASAEGMYMNWWDGSEVFADPTSTRSVEAQIDEQMKEYYSRSASSAAQVLTDAQLAEFQKTLDLRMAQRRGMMERSRISDEISSEISRRAAESKP